MTRPPFRLLALLLALSVWGVPRATPLDAQSPGSAAVFGGGQARGGLLDTRGVDAPGPIQWEVQTDGPVRSSPIVADGIVYVGSHDGVLYAIELESGRAIWEYDVGEPINSAPTIAADFVVVSDRHGSLHAVGRVDGALRWVDHAGPALDWPWGLEGWDYVGSTPVFSDGVIVAGSSDGRIRAVDATTGSPRWSVATDGRIRSTPAIAGGVVYVGSADGIVRALDVATGSERWSFRTHGADFDSEQFGFDRRTISGGPAVRDGRVYIGSRDARMYALDANTGELVWESDDNGAMAWVISTPAVTPELVLFGRSSSAKVQAVDRTSGEVAWDAPLGGLVFASPAIVDGLAYVTVGGLAYVNDGGGSLAALDVATGALAWSVPLEAASYSSPTVADGMVIVGADDGIVRAIRAADGPPARVAVYFDSATATPSLSNARGEAEAIASRLEEEGFEGLDGGTLADWLEARIRDRAPSSVVLATDVLPSDVAEDARPEGLLVEYMRSGGRVVWTSAPPFWLSVNADGSTAVDIGRSERFLGIDFGSWISDSRMMKPSPEGRRWGLEGWWIGVGGIDPAQVDVVLVADEEGGATGWIKSYGGPTGSGWVSLPYAPGDPWLRGLQSVAEHGVTRVR